MEKINQIMAWLTLFISWWLYKTEYKDVDEDGPDQVHVGGNIAPANIQPLTRIQPQRLQKHDDSIISIGLSELMKKKTRLNESRRKEDRRTT